MQGDVPSIVALLLVRFPAVDFRDSDALVADREHQTAVKVLAARVAIQAELTQTASHVGTVLAVLLGQWADSTTGRAAKRLGCDSRCVVQLWIRRAAKKEKMFKFYVLPVQSST